MASARKLFVELGVNDRRLSTDLRKSEKTFRKFGRKVGKGLQRSFSAIKMAAGGGAAFGFASTAKDVFEFEDALNRIEIQAGMTAGETDAMRQSMIAMSNDMGLSRTQVVATASSLMDLTGDIDFTRGAMEVLAKANLATGGSMEELAGLAFSLQKSFDLTDPKDLENGLSAIIEAGKLGAIPLGEMSLVLQQLSANFANLSGTGVAGAADLASALQVLRPAFGSASEAGTGLAGMLTAFKKNSKGLKKVGIKIFEKDENGVEQFRSMRDILDDFENSKIAKSKSGLIKIMGRAEGALAFETLRKSRAEFDRLSAAARQSNAVQEDSDKRRQSSAFKMQKAWNDIKEAIAEALTPERIETFVAAIESLARLVGVIADNLKAAAAIMIGMKFGPGLAGLAMAGGGAMGKTAAGAAMNGLGKGSLKGLGLVAAAGAAGYALGTFADKALGLSDGLSDAALSIFGPGKIARQHDGSKEGLAKRLASGELTQAEHDKKLASKRSTFAFAGANDLQNLIAAKIEKESGMSFADQQKRVAGMGAAKQEELRAMAHQALIASAQGGDVNGLVDKLALAIRGAPIKVVVSGRELNTILDESIPVTSP